VREAIDVALDDFEPPLATGPLAKVAGWSLKITPDFWLLAARLKEGLRGNAPGSGI